MVSGGSYGSSYGGNGYRNSYAPPNRPAQDRQARGRTYSDICQVFGRPGINTGSASGVFCPYTG
uniref:Uncharacterized protein n=1 Tax=Phlebotomus papatasi TaxID=29031 RepID=A0A1B0DHW8_PHLPP